MMNIKRVRAHPKRRRVRVCRVAPKARIDNSNQRQGKCDEHCREKAHFAGELRSVVLIFPVLVVMPFDCEEHSNEKNGKFKK
jgi:hypothetical protein